MLADSRSSSGSFDSCNLICHLLYHSFRTDHKIMAWVSGNIALNQCENHAQNWVLLMFILGWLCCVCHRQCLSECEFSESSVMLILSNRIQRPSCIVNDIFTEMWRSTVEQFLIHNYCLKYQKRVLTFYHSSCVLLVCISLYTCVLWCIDLFQFVFCGGFFVVFFYSNVHRVPKVLKNFSLQYQSGGCAHMHMFWMFLHLPVFVVCLSCWLASE